MLNLSREAGLKRIATMRTTLWCMAGVLVLVSGLTIWWVLRANVLRPVDILREAIVRVGCGERDVILPTHWKDELGQVASVFKDMQRQLVANEKRIKAVTTYAFDSIITTDSTTLGIWRP